MIEIRFTDTPRPFFAYEARQEGGELVARGYRLERVWQHWTDAETGLEMSAYRDIPGETVEESWPLHRIESRRRVEQEAKAA